MALPFFGAWNAPYMADGDARPTISKGDPTGRPYLWDWRMGSEVSTGETPVPLPFALFPISIP
jgi:hypothetical protein